MNGPLKQDKILKLYQESIHFITKPGLILDICVFHTYLIPGMVLLALYLNRFYVHIHSMVKLHLKVWTNSVSFTQCNMSSHGQNIILQETHQSKLNDAEILDLVDC